MATGMKWPTNIMQQPQHAHFACSWPCDPLNHWVASTAFSNAPTGWMPATFGYFAIAIWTAALIGLPWAFLHTFKKAR